ncbi:sigma factor, partial [Peptoniphilus harei]
MDNQDLIERLKNKDEDALYIFIEDYGKILKGVISKTLWKYPNLWDEAMNDALLIIWQNIQYFDPSRSTFKNWCALVAKYRAIDILRKEIKFESLRLDEDSK